MTRNRPLALVTGGSSGIGEALACRCIAGGHDVLVTGSSDRVHETARDLAAGTGAQVLPVQSDLRTAEGVAAVWAAVRDTGRPLDVAMLNAGVSLGGAGFVDTELDEELAQIELNVVSQVRLAKLVVRDMVSRGSGRILFTSSVSATTPTPYETVYGPTRAFVSSFAQSLREELQGTGVSVTTLMPGPTATGFHDRAGMGDTSFGDNSWKNDPADVAHRGYAALMAGRDHVVGGDRATRRGAALNKLLPDRVKAARQAKLARPR